MAKRNCSPQVFPYDDLTYCYGKPVLGGIRPAVYAIPRSELIGFAKLRTDESGTSQENLAVLKGEFIPVPGSYWRKLDIVPTKGSLTWETQGEHPARTFLNKAKFVFPGTCEEATAFARQAIHDFLIFAVQQTDGSWRILGSPEFPADVQVSGGTGEGLGGEVGINIEITATDLCPAPFYKGTLNMWNGDIIFCGNKLGEQYCRNLFFCDPDYGEITGFGSVYIEAVVSEDGKEDDPYYEYEDNGYLDYWFKLPRSAEQNSITVMFWMSSTIPAGSPNKYQAFLDGYITGENIRPEDLQLLFLALDENEHGHCGEKSTRIIFAEKIHDKLYFRIACDKLPTSDEYNIVPISLSDFSQGVTYTFKQISFIQSPQ